MEEIQPKQKQTIGDMMEDQFLAWVRNEHGGGVFIRIFQLFLFCLFTLFFHDYALCLSLLFWLFTVGHYAIPFAFLALFCVGNFSLVFGIIAKPFLWIISLVFSIGKAKKEKPIKSLTTIESAE
ncbi:MAG: hypothetical protein WCJ84_05525 [Candidatus Peregrinibacteria bacterium]